MHTFYQFGEKYAFSPLFSSPFNHFSPQMLFDHIFARPPPLAPGVEEKNIHPFIKLVLTAQVPKIFFSPEYITLF